MSTVEILLLVFGCIFGYGIIGSMTYVLSPESWHKFWDGRDQVPFEVLCLLWPVTLLMAAIYYAGCGFFAVCTKLRKMKQSWWEHRRKRREEYKNAAYGTPPRKKEGRILKGIAAVITLGTIAILAGTLFAYIQG